MTVQALRELSQDELTERLRQAGEQLFRIRFQKSMGNLDGLKQMKAHRLDIARAKTVQRERELASEDSSSTASTAQPRARSARRAKRKA